MRNDVAQHDIPARIAARAAGPADRTGTARAADPSVGRLAPRQLGESRDGAPVARGRVTKEPAAEHLGQLRAAHAIG